MSCANDSLYLAFVGAMAAMCSSSDAKAQSTIVPPKCVSAVVVQAGLGYNMRFHNNCEYTVTIYWPLLKNEWVGSGESVLWARSRAGEARRSEPLTAITGPDNRALLNAGMVRHSAMEARARRCRTNCLKPPS